MIEVEFEYANARIRSMKGDLLGADEMESLIVKPDLDAVIAELSGTPYGKDVETASAQYSGIVAVEVALRRNFTRNFQKILAFLRGDEAEVYIRTLLARWDIQNIKTILRGKNIHADPIEIAECLVPAGDLDETVLTELISQPDVRAVIDLMATWGIEYATPLTRRFSEFIEQRDLSILEYALDMFYYKNALQTVKEGSYNDRILEEMIRTEIDVTNIKTILKMLRDRMDVEDAGKYLIPGGIALDAGRMHSMLTAGTIEGAVKHLEPTPYAFLARAPEDALRGDRISPLEKWLDNYLMQKGIARFLGCPLSIAMAIGYLWAKYREVTNLRIIARCKTEDVSEKELRGELLHV